MKAIRILAAAVLATFAVGAHAQAGPFGPGAGNPGQGMLERLKAADKNGDGMISREEAQASLPRVYEHFDAIDANKDGLITFEELRAARQAHRGALRAEAWNHLDANGDGRLSLDEVANHPRLAQNFGAIDTNGDGFLSPEELRAAHQARGAAFRAAAWRHLDANGDGRLSREEVAGHPRLVQNFDAIDTNRDGFLSPEELRAARGHFVGMAGHGS